MNNSIVLTIISEDHPGIIKAVSTVLSDHGGNWTHSSMSSLAGHFAGILLASVPKESTDACLAELRGLEPKGLRIISRVCTETTSKAKSDAYTLNLVGNDRPGIVHDITTLLASYKVNVQNLETAVEGASMGGGVLFKAKAQLDVPEGVDIDQLEAELEAMANDLMVGIYFQQ